MIRFSSRYVPAMAALLTVALGLMIHGRLTPHRDECLDRRELLDGVAQDPRVTLRTEGPHRTRLEAGQLTGSLRPEAEGAVELPLTIQETFGLPNLLLQPAQALPGRREPDDVEEALLETPDGPLPVRYAYERRGRTVRVTGYFMTYRGEAIRSALWTRMRQGPEAIFTGSYPITLFAIAAQTRAIALAPSLERMNAWLREAWDRYRRTCAP